MIVLQLNLFLNIYKIHACGWTMCGHFVFGVLAFMVKSKGLTDHTNLHSPYYANVNVNLIEENVTQIKSGRMMYVDASVKNIISVKKMQILKRVEKVLVCNKIFSGEKMINTLLDTCIIS